ncbi:hypothetical protein G7Y89_g3164 [Cudoniella acicularis]|uniref:phosphopyruvate hydratase n=1 Tax=Cudoniella acicularis TaxID=354080 RepID=A0A8H4W5F5_9HELO|nr:hypothetical protein G7Y89_g3164 [Cudoniella acicularis]
MDETQVFPPEYLAENRSHSLLVVAVLFIVLETLFISLFFTSRFRGNVPWGMDSYLMVPAFITCIIHPTASLYAIAHAGDGRHIVAITPEEFNTWLKLFVVAMFDYGPSVTFPKLSILCLYLRIFNTKPYRYSVYAIATILISTCLASWVAVFCLCTPYNYTWDKSIPGGHCIDQNKEFTWISFPNIVTDVAMVLLPLPVIWKLHTSRNQKIGLLISFLTFGLGLITSILRFVNFFEIDIFLDPTWSNITKKQSTSDSSGTENSTLPFGLELQEDLSASRPSDGNDQKGLIAHPPHEIREEINRVRKFQGVEHPNAGIHVRKEYSLSSVPRVVQNACDRLKTENKKIMGGKMVSNIAALAACQRLDANGNPALQITVTTSKGIYTSLTAVPSKKNLLSEPRDGFTHVQQAIHNIEHIIAPALIGKNFDLTKDLKKIDGFVTELAATAAEGGDSQAKTVLGKEERMGVSVACARAGADAAGVPLYEFVRQESFAAKAPYIMPVPFFTILNGDGVEYTIAPTGATNMASAIKMGTETYNSLKQALEDKLGQSATYTTPTGSFSNHQLLPLEALHLLATTIHSANHTGSISIGLNAASFTALNSQAKIDLYHELMTKYPITLLEDPFPEDEWESWSAFTASGKREGEEWKGVAMVDREVMGQERMQDARGRGVCNGVLLELDDFVNLSEVFAAANQAFSYGWGVFISHSGTETSDSFIADLAVGLRCGHLKAGAPARGENTTKYNRLLDIEEEITAKGEEIKYAGEEFRLSHGRPEESKVPFNVYGY